MRRKHGVKVLSILLCLIMVFSLTTTGFAAEIQIDPYSVEGVYVEKLVTLSEEEIAALPLNDAQELFEEAFLISSEGFTEDEVRLALDGWSYALKVQTVMDTVREVERIAASSTTSDKTYYGSIGLAWVRDTTSSGTPLTLGEILSGVYTLEVDYISWKTAATILAASSDYDIYEDLVGQVASGASGTVLGAIVCSALGITGTPATITSAIVGIAVSFGWSWLDNIDRDNMYECFEDMDEDEYMKVQFMWASDMVNKFYTSYSPSSYTFENPFPGTYGTWYTGTYGYLYSY